MRGSCSTTSAGRSAIGAYAGKRKEVFPGWAASIKALAARPNVYVKVGGLGMRIGGFGFDKKAEPPSSETLATAWRPYVETCIEAFGPSRCMFESNFPGRQGLLQLSGVLECLQAAGKGASDAEKADLFAGTAARFYRLGAIPSPKSKLKNGGVQMGPFSPKREKH